MSRMGAGSGNRGWIKMKQNQPRSAQVVTSKNSPRSAIRNGSQHRELFCPCGLHRLAREELAGSEARGARQA